jgi:hypothetical protein
MNKDPDVSVFAVNELGKLCTGAVEMYGRSYWNILGTTVWQIHHCIQSPGNYFMQLFC